MVDDDPEIRKFIRIICGNSGYDVMEAEDGAQAIKALTSGEENSKSDGGEKNEKKTPEETKESGANPQLRVPPLNLDEKITWRSTPERTRLILRATFRSPRIVRKSVQPDTQQTPVSWGAEVARN